MSRDLTQIRRLAAQLLAFEKRDKKLNDGTSPAAQVCKKLSPRLAPLFGTTGFKTLLVRALQLANTDNRSLRDVRVSNEGLLIEVAERHTHPSARELTAGEVVLIAQLLSLLIAFVGERLTLQIVREVWPDLHIRDLNLTKGSAP